MSVPSSITALITGLQTAYSAAGPVETAPPLVVADLEAKADAIILALDAAIVSAAAKTAGFNVGTSALSAAAALTSVASNLNDELDLFEVRGFMGRAHAMLETQALNAGADSIQLRAGQ